MGNMFPRLGKLAFTRKMCVFTSGKYVTLLGKIVFKANTWASIVGIMFSLPGKILEYHYLEDSFYRERRFFLLLENMSALTEKRVFTGKNMYLH